MTYSTVRGPFSRSAFTAFGTAALAVATLAIGACDDPTEVEDHFDMNGFAILMADDEIYRYTLDDTVVDTLVVPVGAHDLVFIPVDHEGEYMMEEEGEHEEDEHVLEISSDDTTIVTWTPEEHSEESVHGWIEFHGRLNAFQAGSAHLQVCVPHEGHCDFKVDHPGVPGVPVTVTAQ